MIQNRYKKVFSYDSMALIPTETKFEAIPPKNVGGIAFLAETYVLRQMLGLCEKIFSCSSNASDFKIFGIPVKRPVQKCILFLCSLVLKLLPSLQKRVARHKFWQ